MRYIEVIVDTPEEQLDQRCEEMAAWGVGGFVIENEADFQRFLANNHAYWDYVDKELEQQYAGLSRIKCYLTDDEEGQAQLRHIRSAPRRSPFTIPSRARRCVSRPPRRRSGPGRCFPGIPIKKRSREAPFSLFLRRFLSAAEGIWSPAAP